MKHGDLGPVAAAFREADMEIEALGADLEAVAKSLDHCRNVLAEHERRPGPDLDGFMSGALRLAKEALARPDVQAVLEGVKDG